MFYDKPDLKMEQDKVMTPLTISYEKAMIKWVLIDLKGR